jgi:hypothetical protein
VTESDGFLGSGAIKPLLRASLALKGPLQPLQVSAYLGGVLVTQTNAGWRKLKVTCWSALRRQSVCRV